jgi:hypothetical protein
LLCRYPLFVHWICDSTPIVCSFLSQSITINKRINSFILVITNVSTTYSLIVNETGIALEFSIVHFSYQSPWRNVFNSCRNQSRITLTGVDFNPFHLIKKDFTKYYKSYTPFFKDGYTKELEKEKLAGHSCWMLWLWALSLFGLGLEGWPMFCSFFLK